MSLFRSLNNSSLVPYYTDRNGYQVAVSVYGYQDGSIIIPYSDEADERTYTFRTASGMTYSDISFHWARSYIEDVSRLSAFIGTGSRYFSPDLSMTYGMFVTVPGRLSGEYIDGTNGYAPYLRWADRMGISSRIPVMSENEPVTRETAAVLPASFAEYMGVIDTKGKGAVNRYLDAYLISPWAHESVGMLTHYDVITGRDTGCFDPKATLTRAETAVLVSRIIPFIVDGVA